MITIYARKEKTTDRLADFVHGNTKAFDTVFYNDREGTELIARKPWYQTGHPRRNSKTVTLNCHRYELQWIDDGGAQ